MAPQTLRIHSPTSSTTSYTVSTRRVPKSALGRLLERTLVILRIITAVVCLWVLVIVVGDWLSFGGGGGGSGYGAGGVVMGDPGGAVGVRGGARDNVQLGQVNGTGMSGTQVEVAGEGGKKPQGFGAMQVVAVGYVRMLEGILAETLGERAAVLAMIAGICACLWRLAQRGYVEDTLLTLSTLGILTSTSSPSILLPPTTRFIPTSSIQDIFIYEAFTGFQVRYYLAVVVEGEEEAVVVFPRALPRRRELEGVWRGVRGVLWGKGGRRDGERRSGRGGKGGAKEDVLIHDEREAEVDT